MIRSFRSKALAAFWQSGDAGRLDARIASKLRTRLTRLDLAVAPREMNAPGYYFHQLKGARRGVFSIRVTGNWRLTFGWQETDAIDVDLEDYH
jgi:proteic killer suppression protein